MQLLQHYYNADAPQVMALNEELQQLNQFDLTPHLPNISHNLRLIQQLMEQRQSPTPDHKTEQRQ